MNLFIVRDGHLVTPDVSQGILEGITRDTVMTVAREQSIALSQERPVDRTELYVADEVFLCGTAAEIAPVTMIDGRPVGDGKPGRITLSLQRAYDLVVRGGASCRPGWVEPVYGHMGAANRG